MIGWIILVAWFTLGVWFAPRAAALCYRTSPWVYEDIKMDSAKVAYVLSVFFGPVVMAFWGFRIYVFGNLREITDSRLEKSLIRHDPGYRAKHLEDQTRRIDQLTRENERLTRQVLEG